MNMPAKPTIPTRQVTLMPNRNDTVAGLGSSISSIPPRTLNERLRLAIRWSRDYHDKVDDPDGELAAKFVRHLGHLGLKLVWRDGPDLTPEQIQD